MLHSRPRHSLRNLFLKQYLQGRWFNIILPTQPTTIIPRIKQAEFVVNVQNSNCRLARQSHNKWLHIKNNFETNLSIFKIVAHSYKCNVFPFDS